MRHPLLLRTGDRNTPNGAACPPYELDTDLYRRTSEKPVKAKFRECITGEVPRIHLPRRWLNKGPGQRKEDKRKIPSPRSSSDPEVLKVLFLGTVLQDERDIYVDFVASDVAVIYEDVHVLDPLEAAIHAYPPAASPAHVRRPIPSRKRFAPSSVLR